MLLLATFKTISLNSYTLKWTNHKALGQNAPALYRRSIGNRPQILAIMRYPFHQFKQLFALTITCLRELA